MEVRSKVAGLVGATRAKIANPVVLVLGWVALEYCFEFGGHEQFGFKCRCGAKSHACWGNSGGNCISCHGAGGGRWSVALNLGGMSRPLANGRPKQVKTANPAVVLVVGWVALECRSQSGRYEQIQEQWRCAPLLDGEVS